MKNKPMSSSSRQDFIDWAIGKKKEFSGKRRELGMLETQIALARKIGRISEEDEKRFHNS